jgi:hypothetical protein
MLAKETSLTATLSFFTALIVIYSTFIFYFYRFLAKKNIIELNLNQYNQYTNTIAVKALATTFYIIEYIILLPVLTFFWFSVLAILILLIAKGLAVNSILLIAAALVASVRIISYINEDLSKDLAKMLPFTLLAIAITTAGFFDIQFFFDRITEIPNLFSSIPYYLLFIVLIELIMRIAEFLYSVFLTSRATEEETPSEEEEEESEAE